MEIDIELLHKERKQWRENSLLQSKSILRLSQELDNLRKQKEILQEKLLLGEALSSSEQLIIGTLLKYLFHHGGAPNGCRKELGRYSESS